MKYQYPSSSSGSGTIMVNEKLERNNAFSLLLFCATALLCLSIFIFCLTHSPKLILGESMQPTINASFDNKDHYDIVLVNNTKNIHRGDIIIYDYTSYDTRVGLIIKRVVAVSGDTINIKWDSENQKLEFYLKKPGETEFSLIQEDYIKKDPNDNTKDSADASYCASSFQAKNYSLNSKRWHQEGISYDLHEDGSITIKEGYFFALGDNRGLSTDGSEHGPFDCKDIVGVVDVIMPDGTFLNNVMRTVFGVKHQY